MSGFPPLFELQREEHSCPGKAKLKRRDNDVWSVAKIWIEACSVKNVLNPWFCQHGTTLKLNGRYGRTFISLTWQDGHDTCSRMRKSRTGQDTCNLSVFIVPRFNLLALVTPGFPIIPSPQTVVTNLESSYSDILRRENPPKRGNYMAPGREGIITGTPCLTHAIDTSITFVNVK